MLSFDRYKIPYTNTIKLFINCIENVPEYFIDYQKQKNDILIIIYKYIINHLNEQIEFISTRYDCEFKSKISKQILEESIKEEISYFIDELNMISDS